MRFLIHLTAALALVVGLSACSKSALIPNVHSVVASGHSEQQVRDAILRAGKANNWIMNEAEPGVINARVQTRGHIAQVRIPYSSSSYSIDYVSSDGLSADNGKIHRNYVRWVRNLDKNIQINLSVP